VFAGELPDDVHEAAVKKKKTQIHSAVSDFMLLPWLSPCRAPRCSSAYHTPSPAPVAHLMCRIFGAIRQPTLHHGSASIMKR
jgi:hypothetical protein